MLCATCGVENPRHANFCPNCGSVLAAVVGVPHTVITDAPAPFYYSAVPSKVYLLGSLSFGFYSIWWFWSQFRAEDPNEGRGWALFRTILSGFFLYGMAREVQEEAFRREVKCRCPPVILTVAWWMAALTAKLGSQVLGVAAISQVWALAAIWALPVPLTVIQVTINRVNNALNQQEPTGWRWWETTVAILCGLCWLLIGLGLLLGAPSPPSTTNA